MTGLVKNSIGDKGSTLNTIIDSINTWCWLLSMVQSSMHVAKVRGCLLRMCMLKIGLVNPCNNNGLALVHLHTKLIPTVIGLRVTQLSCLEDQSTPLFSTRNGTICALLYWSTTPHYRDVHVHWKHTQENKSGLWHVCVHILFTHSVHSAVA